jgi:hypothetical protein
MKAASDQHNERGKGLVNRPAWVISNLPPLAAENPADRQGYAFQKSRKPDESVFWLGR